MHLVVMMLAVLRHHPKRTVPTIGADCESVASECKLGTYVLAGPKEPPPLRKGNTLQALDRTAESIEPNSIHLETDTLVVFLRFHGRDAERSH